MDTDHSLSIDSIPEEGYSSYTPPKSKTFLQNSVQPGIICSDTSLDQGEDSTVQEPESLSSHLVLMKAVARLVGLSKTSTEEGVLMDDHISSTSATSYSASSRSTSIGRLNSAKYHISNTKFNTIFMLHPTGTGVLYWNMIITFVVAYNLILIPIRSVFPLFQEKYVSFWYFLDSLSDFYYLLDIFVQTRISHLEQGCLISHWKLMARYYIFSQRFVIDIVSLLPVDLFIIYSHLTPYHNYVIFLRIIRLIKAYKIRIFVDRIEARSDHPNVIRIVALVIILMIFIHLNACLYFFVSTTLGYGVGDFPWAYPGAKSNVYMNGNRVNIVIPKFNTVEQYLNCLHWSTQMLTTIGEVNAPTKAIEYIYATVSLLFGVLLFATLVGNVGTIITNLNAARTRFESRLDNVKQYMHNRNISKDLKESVLRWFDHLWEKSRGIDEQETLQNLPNKLRARIAIRANRRILGSNPIYLSGDKGFKIDLMLRFRSELFPPNEAIYEKGHIGNEMYIIRSGTVNLTKREKGQTRIGMECGQFFGMSCVINFNEFGRERSETATTVGFCDLLVLEKKDLLELLIDYPNVKAKLDQLFVKEFMTDQFKQEQTERFQNINKYIHQLATSYTDLQEQYEQLSTEHNRLQALYTNLIV
ncbi:Cyclic nucleotide-gated channel photoreceptor [Oopsacas minuta]|uniref:Cyclic nucleotide-gated channel photoreceptor n=1 Tax=Oopsacas minuta TaxID=111878 RepID=A0AAV7K8T7_9METZ|nr:Cyclic nucleotide-gated channel photoreceptor [Oopsacas minuta]